MTSAERRDAVSNRLILESETVRRVLIAEVEKLEPLLEKLDSFVLTLQRRGEELDREGQRPDGHT
jgi:hypothetical protein